MKCPKCGYNSFEHLDSCKKCGKDLVSFKQQFGITSVLFPGQLMPLAAAAETEAETVVAEEFEEVSKTAAAAAEAETAGVVEAEDLAATQSGGADDFGFDFMGESEGEEDLSFDELFEEAPADEDVEETLPEPEQQAGKQEAEDDFVFDMEAEGEQKESSQAEEDLAGDFGFDLDESQGTKEDPKDPFEDPGFPQEEEIPEQVYYDFEEEHSEPQIPGGMSSPFASSDSPEVAAPVEEITQAEASVASVPSAPSLADESPHEETLPFDVSEPTSAQDLESSSTILASPATSFAAEDSLSSESSAATAEMTETQVEEKEFSLGSPPAEEDITTEKEGFIEAQRLLPPVGSRIFAFVCDLLLLLVVGTSFILAAEAAMSDSGGGLFPSAETLLDLSIPYFLVLFFLAFGYFTLFHFLVGQTPGKMLAGLRVETLDGEPLAFSQAFLRSVGGLLQLLPVGIGYLMILLSSERRGWNDQLAGTRLINLKALPVEV